MEKTLHEGDGEGGGAKTKCSAETEKICNTYDAAKIRYIYDNFTGNVHHWMWSLLELTKIDMNVLYLITVNIILFC